MVWLEVIYRREKTILMISHTKLRRTRNIKRKVDPEFSFAIVIVIVIVIIIIMLT